MKTTTHEYLRRIGLICLNCMLFISLGYGGESAKADSDSLPVRGIFKRTDGGKLVPRPAPDIFGSRRSVEGGRTSGSGGGLMASSVESLSASTVTISFFSIVPSKPIPAQEEAAYKGVLEEARRNIVPGYYQAVDTTQRKNYYYGDIRLKVFLDDTGAVTSCIIDDYSMRDQSIRETTQKNVSELSFKPVHTDTSIEGFIVVFSFSPDVGE